MYIWMFVIGALHVPFYAQLWPVGGLLAALLAAVAARLLFASLNYRSTFLACACFFAGMVYGTLRLQVLYSSQLNEAFEGQTFKVVASVESIPQKRGKSASFIARVTRVDCDGGLKCPDIAGKHIRVSWFFPDIGLSAGQVWALSLKLKRPRGLVNPGGFDYHAWLLSKGIVATASVRGGKAFEQKLMLTERNLAAHRWAIGQKLLGEGRYTYQRIWQALLIGDRSLMSNDDWKLLQATGTVHLMAISGLHIGLVALLGFAIGSFVARTMSIFVRGSGARVFVYLPASFSLVCATYYAALAGFSIPTQRALVACVVVNLARFSACKVPPERLLAICLLFVCLLEPMAWVSVGFWLSFGAVFVLMYTLVGRPNVDKVRASINAQLVIFIGLLIPILSIGQGVSVVSPLANLIAVPLMSLVVIPLLFLSSILQGVAPTLTEFLMSLNEWVLAKLWWVLTLLADLPIAQWWPNRALSFALLACGFAASLLVLSPRAIGLRSLGAVLLICCAFGRFSRPEEFELVVLDVGQGLSVHISTPKSQWVYDAGPRYQSGFDTGERIILPYLRRQGVNKVSMIISHDDLDHSGGARALSDGLNVERILAGEELKHIPGKKYQRCYQGQSWQDESLSFDVLWPPYESQWEGNRASCVVLVTYDSGLAAVTALFTGDIDSYVERRITHLLPSGVDILVAPHHGSNSSSSAIFIEQLKPDFVVFSTGYYNRFGHPGEKALSRYQEQGVATLNTAEHGAVTFRFGPQGELQVFKARDVYRRAWF